MPSEFREPAEVPTADAEVAEHAEVRGEAPRGELLHRATSGIILGAFYAVHSELGYGFLESVYANALQVLLRGAGLRVEREVPFEIMFHGHQIGVYRADLIVDSRVVVEVKAGEVIIPQHLSQLLNYLKATGLSVGLLLNFGPRAKFKRLVSTPLPGRWSNPG